MDTLTVSLFGRLCCTVNARPVGGLEARKVQELFIYLLLHRTRPCTRESLATVLWGERDEVHAKKYLRQALWQLQSALESACHPHRPLLLVDNEWIGIHPEAPLWLDVEAFESAYATLRAQGNRVSSPQVAETLCQAAALYQGDLLEGWYQDWCVFERERFLQMYLAILDALIDYAEQTQSYADGVHFCELVLRKDAARERTHRRLMRLHYQAGNRSAALRQFELCKEILQRELNVAPSKSTLALYEEIRSERLEAPARSPDSTSELIEMQAVLEELTRLQSTLLHTLQQVHCNIERMEHLMRRHLAT
ncbi:MAG: bacterial transcriptional activator domain-containing protein [Caldilinea sp.]|uniref:AfsR/SARP family transcriptional regulator n=1 Tax=Caldilinea sp. TaxID=2293560 RepID=UPI0030AD8102